MAEPTRKQTLIIYHANCVDGACAAWCAWRRFGEDAEYRPWNYGSAAPTNEEVEGRDVYILDFSFKRPELERMHKQAKSLRVIDHHKSAQEDLGDLPYATFDMEHSGAYLAYMGLAQSKQSTVPEIVKYVEDRDLWRWQLPFSKEISAAIASLGVVEDFRQFNEIDAVVSSPSDFYALVRTGKGILSYQDETVRIALTRKMQGWLRTVDGQVVQLPIVNATTLFSEVAGALAEDSLIGVAAAWFIRADGILQVSLRVRGDSDFDASALAKGYGGGGHKKAAGFESDLGDFRKLFFNSDGA